MPENNFVALKRQLKREARAAGHRLPDSLAHRVAQSILLEQFAIEEANKDPESQYRVLQHSDRTGETAIANVLVEKFIKQYRAQKKNGPGTIAAKQCSEAVKTTH